MTEATAVVEMRNIKKSFAAVQALRGVDLVLHHNEVLGLVGDNAAGKSTLMKVLSGAYIPDEGEILIEGERVHMANPLDARRLGIDGVLVLHVEKGGPADSAGIRPTVQSRGEIILGDVIVALDGNKIRSYDDLRDVLEKYQPGQQVAVTVSRDGEVREIPVLLSVVQ